jgi:chromosome segregation ATPase
MELDVYFGPIRKAFEGLPSPPSPCPCPPSPCPRLADKNEELERALAAVADLESKLEAKRAKYEENVAALQARFDATVHTMTQELASEAAQHEEKVALLEARFDTTVHALTEELTSERAAHSAASHELDEMTKREADRFEELEEMKDAKKRKDEQLRALTDEITRERAAHKEVRIALTITKVDLEAATKLSAAQEAQLTAVKTELEATKRREAEQTAARFRLSQELEALKTREATLTRERDNLAGKYKTSCDNAVQNNRLAGQLHEQVAMLEHQLKESAALHAQAIAALELQVQEAQEEKKKTRTKAAPRHPVAVPNSSAKSRPRRSLSSGAPRVLDLTTADSGDDDGEEEEVPKEKEKENATPGAKKLRSANNKRATGTPRGWAF